MSYTPMPIIIPIDTSEPDTCPKCGKEEDIKQVCGHCGYVYPEDDESSNWWVPIAVIIFIILVFWVLWTLVQWFGGFEDSLWEVLKMQWRWVSRLKII